MSRLGNTLGEIINLIARGDFEVADALCDAEIDRLLRCKREIETGKSARWDGRACLHDGARSIVVYGKTLSSYSVGLGSYGAFGHECSRVKQKRRV